jgi:DNA repair exonuclease SbcCD ATPase subunit
VTAENFLSTGKEVSLDFDKGISVIVGVNHDKGGDTNGCGKSTMMEAVYFCLYGVTMRDINKDEIVNDLVKKGCVCTLELDVEENGTTDTYIIKRGINPSYAKVYKNGEDMGHATMPAATAFIAELISTSVATCRNTLMMAIDTLQPFMKLHKPEKRDFVENIFNLQFIKAMNKIAKENNDEINTKIRMLDKEIVDLNDRINTYTVKSEAFEVNKLKNIEVIQGRIAEVKSEIEELKTKFVKTMPDADFESVVATLNTGMSDINDRQKLISSKKDAIFAESSKYRDNENNISNENARKKRYEEESRDVEAFVMQHSGKSVSDYISSVDIESKKNEISDIIADKTARERLVIDIAVDKKEKTKMLNELSARGNICLACKRPFPTDDVEAVEKNKAMLREEIERLSGEEKVNKECIQAEDEKQKALNEEIRKHDRIMDKISSLKPVQDTGCDVVVLQANNEAILKFIEMKKEEIGILNKEIEDIKVKIEAARVLHEDHKTKVAENRNLQTKIDGLVRVVETNEADLARNRESVNEFKNLLDNTVDKKAAKALELDGWSKKSKIYQFIKEILSENGYRAYLIRQLVRVLNERINHYLKRLEAPCVIEFDEFFENTIIDELTGEGRSYESYSAGERRRIDLSTLMAFMDMRRIQGDVGFNVAFYDEVLDSALSVNGTEKLFEVLNERLEKYGESAYIISHKKENVNNYLVTNKIQMEKTGGVVTLHKI